MSATKFNKSDSDISSDSSWTMLDDDVQVEKKSSTDFKLVSRSETTIPKSNNAAPNPSSSPPSVPLASSTSESNCAKANSIKTEPLKKRAKMKKSKTKKCDNVNLMSLAASLLVVTGISLLFLMCPQKDDPKAGEKVRSNFMEMAANKNLSTAENALNSLKKTAEVLEVANQAKVMETISKNITKDLKKFQDLKTVNKQPPHQCPATHDEDVFVTPKNLTTTRAIEYKKKPVVLSCANKMEPRFKLHKTNGVATSSRFNLSSIRRFMENYNLHFILSTLIQDICIIKLISLITKRVEANDKMLDHRVKSKTKKSLKLKSANDTKKKHIKSEPKPTTVARKSLSHNVLLPPLTPPTPDKTISEVVVNINKNLAAPYSGTSECEKRFEELEKRWQHIGINHRQIIHNIRQNFQNEVNEIKDGSCRELVSRQERIMMTRQKYCQRLKLNREKYLIELRKLRDERQRLLRQLCHHKNALAFDYHNKAQKDVSVGNYALVLPGCYDFQQKLKVIKEKENNNNDRRLIVKPADSSSTITAKNSVSSFNSTSSDATIIVRVDEKLADDIEDRLLYDENRRRMNKLKQKYLKKRSRMLMKRDRFANSGGNSVSKCAAATAEVAETFDKDACQVAENISGVKKLARDIYEAAFDKSAAKNNDTLQWSQDYDNTIFQDIIGKQDPQKIHKDKFVFKEHL